VARLKVCADFASFAPVRTAVKAPPSPSRWDVGLANSECLTHAFALYAIGV